MDDALRIPGHPPLTISQVGPANPTSHAHPKMKLPSAESCASHRPCPLQLRAHALSTVSHPGPPKPASHRHSPKTHAPWPLQFDSHRAKAETEPQSAAP